MMGWEERYLTGLAGFSLCGVMWSVTEGDWWITGVVAMSLAGSVGVLWSLARHDWWWE
jgi:hypothetical protein